MIIVKLQFYNLKRKARILIGWEPCIIFAYLSMVMEAEMAQSFLKYCL